MDRDQALQEVLAVEVAVLELGRVFAQRDARLAAEITELLLMNVPRLIHVKNHVKDVIGQVTCPQKCHSMWWDQYRPSSPPSLQCTGSSPDWPTPPWPTLSPRCTSTGCPLSTGLYRSWSTAPRHWLQSLMSNFVSHCFCCWSALLPQLGTQLFSAEPIAGVEGVLTLPRWKAVWRGHGARDASPGRRRRRPCYLSPVRARPTKGPVPPAWHAPAYDSENTWKPPEPPEARFHNWFLLS